MSVSNCVVSDVVIVSTIIVVKFETVFVEEEIVNVVVSVTGIIVVEVILGRIVTVVVVVAI